MKYFIVYLSFIFIFFCNNLFAQNNSIDMFVNSFDGLNIRISPSTSANRIKSLPFLARVSIIQRNENVVIIDGITSYWFQIQTENDIGWVFGGYLSNISQETERLVGDWQTELNYFRFFSNGRYIGGRKHSSLRSAGNWRLSNDNFLFISGEVGDDSGEIIMNRNINILKFINNDVIEITYENDSKRIYERRELIYEETGLRPVN